MILEAATIAIASRIKILEHIFSSQRLFRSWRINAFEALAEELDSLACGIPNKLQRQHFYMDKG